MGLEKRQAVACGQLDHSKPTLIQTKNNTLPILSHLKKGPLCQLFRGGSWQDTWKTELLEKPAPPGSFLCWMLAWFASTCNLFQEELLSKPILGGKRTAVTCVCTYAQTSLHQVLVLSQRLTKAEKRAQASPEEVALEQHLEGRAGVGQREFLPSRVKTLCQGL